MNVLNIRRNNVNIASANYVIKPLKSIYLYPSVLVVGLYQTYRNDITELVSIALVSITSVKLDLRQAKNRCVWKVPNKTMQMGTKKYVIIT